MRITVRLIFIFALVISEAYGQADELEYLVDEGIKLHDSGDYTGAIQQYQKALIIDKKSPVVHYEISSTYFALKDYDKAIEHCDKVISAKSNYVDYAYVVKGSALDLLGKSKEAIKTYQQAIKEFPKNQLLYYNLALTSYNLKEYKEVEDALQKALVLKPSHASSHLLLGYCMRDQGNRAQSILALYNFLLLEPNSKRAISAYELLTDLLAKGVRKENESTTTITISSIEQSEEFLAAELLLSLLAASRGTEVSEIKTVYELFFEQTKSFFTVLGELKKDKEGFWWNYYVDYFYSMANDDHVETFSYYISQSKQDEHISIWLSDNDDKMEALSEWYINYERKF